MARSRLLLAVIVVAAAVTANPSAALTVGTTSVHHPPLLDYTPAPSPSMDGGDIAFRANLASALLTTTTSAAAARKGFATAQSGEAGHDHVFARGLCFGAVNQSSWSTGAKCLSCLSAAAMDVATKCNGSRRGAVWHAGCFLSYADTNASSAHEDAFHGWFYAAAVPNTTILDRECAADRSAADCDRCFHDSARAAAAAALGWWQRIHHEEVLVVGYACYLRVQISALPLGPNYVTVRRFLFDLWMSVMVYTQGLIIVMMFVAILAGFYHLGLSKVSHDSSSGWYKEAATMFTWWILRRWWSSLWTSSGLKHGAIKMQYGSNMDVCRKPFMPTVF
ncbi:hypothetical protein QOZ80_2BG0165370 [Eleusine coracana subsp. coracana]|nr:hypothetical protein QOZ80_2BG0165370 [Eleusine coracana subsp. coracana]